MPQLEYFGANEDLTVKLGHRPRWSHLESIVDQDRGSHLSYASLLSAILAPGLFESILGQFTNGVDLDHW